MVVQKSFKPKLYSKFCFFQHLYAFVFCVLFMYFIHLVCQKVACCIISPNTLLSQPTLDVKVKIWTNNNLEANKSEWRATNQTPGYQSNIRSRKSDGACDRSRVLLLMKTLDTSVNLIHKMMNVIRNVQMGLSLLANNYTRLGWNESVLLLLQPDFILIEYWISQHLSIFKY